MAQPEKAQSAKIFLAGNLGYLEQLMKEYGEYGSLIHVYQKEKEKFTNDTVETV